jgi:WD40 repeat protein
MSVAFGPDGQWIVSGLYDGTVRIWSFETDEEISRLRLTQGILRLTKGAVSDKHKVMTIAVSPAGDRIVAGTYGGSIYVWKKG